MSAKRLAALAVVAAIVACNTDSTTSPNVPTGFVQFINAAPRYSTVNFFVDTSLALSSMPYGSDSLFVYVQALATPRTFSAYTGTTLIASTQFRVQADTFYTVVLTQHTTNGGFIVLPDTVSAPASGQAKIRVVNVAPGVPTPGTVDVYITSPSTDLTTVTPSAANVAFESSSLYIPFTSATVRIRVTAAGTKTVLLDLNPPAFSAGQVWTVLLLDAPGGGSPFQSAILGDRM